MPPLPETKDFFSKPLSQEKPLVDIKNGEREVRKIRK